MPTNCITEGLAAYTPNLENPWNKQKVLHLYRRLGYGPTLNELQSALAQPPSQHIDAIFDAIVASPITTPPEYADWTALNYLVDGEFDNDLYIAHAVQWIYQVIRNQKSDQFRAKIIGFWSSHFVTQLSVYNQVQPLYKYHKLMEEMCLGNFKNFVLEMGRTPAMLNYLNGADSTAANPNENYARELYELFTLGQDNGYTQNDIEETARALTGWEVELAATPIFNEGNWDAGSKNIFGQLGNWGYEDVIDILFQQRSDQIAEHICGEIYRYFVSDTINENIVAEMANTFKFSNFEIAPVFRQLFKSEHFFSDQAMGVKIKSPYELEFSLIRELDLAINLDGLNFIYSSTELMGQRLLDPPDVSGWDGYHSWITGSNLILRWDVAYAIVAFQVEENTEGVMNFVKGICNNSNDPEVVTRSYIDHFLIKGLLNEMEYQAAVDVFKGEVPQNYFDDGTWNLDWDVAIFQIVLLHTHLSSLPAFQLT